MIEIYKIKKSLTRAFEKNVTLFQPRFSLMRSKEYLRAVCLSTEKTPYIDILTPSPTTFRCSDGGSPLVDNSVGGKTERGEEKKSALIGLRSVVGFFGTPVQFAESFASSFTHLRTPLSRKCLKLNSFYSRKRVCQIFIEEKYRGARPIFLSGTPRAPS
jgi:hypothetical protein